MCNEQKTQKHLLGIKSKLYYFLLITFIFTLLNTSAFARPGIRTYTREDIDKEKELPQEDNAQYDSNSIPIPPAPQTEVVQSDEEENEQNKIANLPAENPYKVERYTNTTTTTAVNNLPVTVISRNDIEKFRATEKEIREKKQVEAECIQISEQDIAEGKQRIINKIGIDVPQRQ